MTQNNIYLLLTVGIIFVRAVDLRMYVWSSIGGEALKGNFPASRTKMLSISDVNSGNDSKLIFPYMTLTKILDDRARVVDLVCLIVLIELWINNIFVSHLLIVWILIASLARFFAGLYITVSRREAN